MPGAGRTIAEAIKWIVKYFGPEILVWVRTKLKGIWAKRFAKKNIVILGPKQTGKSSLICYLSDGRPFKVVDGVIQTPDPTGAAVILSEDFKLPEGVPIHIHQDVAGDPHFRSQWKDLLQVVRPQGIIYMLDGSRGDDAIRAGIGELFQDVLSHYKTGLNSLAALHIFLNFADRWKTAPSLEHKKVDYVRGILHEVRAQHPELEVALDHIRFHIAATQLSPRLKAWPETDRALIHFSADIA